MPYLKRVFHLFFCAVLIAGVTHDSKGHYLSKPLIIPAKDFFRDGDLIFRKGKGFFSGFFSSAGKGKTPYSHGGLIKIMGNGVFVIHTEASELTGIGSAKIEPIEVFLDNDNAFSGALFRLKDNPEVYGKKAAKVAGAFLQAHIPFDTAFDLKTEDSLYCTELVWLAYKKAGVDIVRDMDILETAVVSKAIVSIGSILNGGKVIFIKKLKEEDV